MAYTQFMVPYLCNVNRDTRATTNKWMTFPPAYFNVLKIIEANNRSTNCFGHLLEFKFPKV